MNPLLLTDGYKTGHHQQYPKGTELVYSNFTPRSNKYAPKGCDKVVSFGQQFVMKKIYEEFQNNFFNRPKSEVIGEIKRELSLYLDADYDVSHFEALHDLGYLPITVKALPEGTLVPIKTPVLTIKNTKPEFYWITNYLETIISNLLWKPMTSATIAYEYRKVLTGWILKTDEAAKDFVSFQGHDFSMRGMDSIDATIASGLGHLTSFMGTDSLPAIGGAREYYGETEFVGGSVNATEHSVMCAGTKDDEIGTFRRLLETYPTGILSVVSDTWDLWKVLTVYLPQLKEEILSRDGKLVIRPDSGDPVDIICGKIKPNSYGEIDFFDEHGEYSTKEQYYNRVKGTKEYNESKGVIELLWDIFGGTINSQGYKVLNEKIGAIYGDSITIDRADEICKRLAAKGFASSNIVLGVGSFTYQYNTRDTFGFAMKATFVQVDGEAREIFKDPITDDGTKKSARGLLKVTKDDSGEYKLVDQVSLQEEESGELGVIFEDGAFAKEVTLTEIRARLEETFVPKEIELV
jgi:nicotinamide phosphoribosyltransferase